MRATVGLWGVMRRLLRSAVPSRPTRYRDIVASYEAYASLQKTRYCSFESDVPKWEAGQRRYIEMAFSAAARDMRILDIACGDGVGLRCFRALGFADVTGVEFNPVKAERAGATGYRVLCQDMHDLSVFADESFDCVYSSHTIEHAYFPDRMVAELVRVLRIGGRLLVVLPYPDVTTENDPAHGAKYELGTNLTDDGQHVVAFFQRHGVRLETKRYDTFREPEIWLTFVRSGS
jgi:SAM-dependent methyltransferase